MTSEKEPLRIKLARHIEKTGYPLEFDISDMLQNAGWGVSANYPYLDPDEGEIREMDIYAMDPNALSDNSFRVPIYLPLMLIECKKSSEHSLVLFPRQEKATFLDLEGQVFDYPLMLGKYTDRADAPGILKMGIAPLLIQDSHYRRMRVCNSYTLTKPKDMKDKPDVFEGVVTLVKTLNTIRDKIQDAKERFIGGIPFHPVVFGYLVIAFDGPMFEAKVTNRHVELQDSQHSLIRFAWNMKDISDLIYYSIDVVSPKYFPTYLKQLAPELAAFRKRASEDRDLQEYLKVTDRIETGKSSRSL